MTHHLDYVGWTMRPVDQLPPHFGGYPCCRVRPLDTEGLDNLGFPPKPPTIPAMTTASVVTVSTAVMTQGIPDMIVLGGVGVQMDNLLLGQTAATLIRLQLLFRPHT